MTPPPVLRDLAILAARLGVGLIFVAHGWQKLAEFGLDRTAASFQQIGVPASQLSAYYATFVELVGGAALIAGLAVPVAGVLLALDMAGAFLFVHAGKGVFVSDGGFELVLALGVACLLLAAVGAGRFGLDRLLTGRLSARRGRHDVTDARAG
jgi:putative oxidoreductase